jgi:hypothetical protein
MRRFQANSPNVIHETIEDEVILIDLKSGTYYSLREAGATVWQAIERGAHEDEIRAAVEQRYEGASDEIRDSVVQLVAELESEGLIRGDQDAAGAAGVPAPVALDEPRVPFIAPVLEKHTDMQDLILIDPVHEVGARGWPHTADAPEANG